MLFALILTRNQRTCLAQLVGFILSLYFISSNVTSYPQKLPAENLTPYVISLKFPQGSTLGGGIVAADLDGHGARDFIVTKPGHIAAYSYDGIELWHRTVDIQVRDEARQVKGGKAVLGEILPGLHGPGVQVADVDGDRQNEVLFLDTQSTLQILQGQTGETRHQVQLPVPDGAEQWEHLVVANFRGQGDRDLLVQAASTAGHPIGRFLAAYAIEDLLRGDASKPSWTRDDFFSAAHNGARVADIDGDGRDEVLAGSLISPEGEKLFEVPIEPDADLMHPHIDSVYVADVRPDLPGLEVVILEESSASSNSILGINHRQVNRVLRLGNFLFFQNKPVLWAAERVIVYNQDGLLWQSHFNYLEPQNAIVGDFDPERDGLEIWCRSRLDEYQSPFVFDARGQLISNYELASKAPSDWTVKGVEVITPIHWTGESAQLGAAKARHESGDVAIFEPITGKFLYRFREAADRLFIADVVGDWREEVIVLNGDQLHVYQNPDANPHPQHKSLWLENAYQRSKMTWNYYSP
jgi:hypothetical protein